MKFSFQIQFDTTRKHPPGPMTARVRQLIEEAGGHVTDATRGTDKGAKYTNLNVEVDDGKTFWHTVKSELAHTEFESLSRKLIVVAEGRHGWSDYLLLHHFEKGEALDQLIDI